RHAPHDQGVPRPARRQAARLRDLRRRRRARPHPRGRRGRALVVPHVAWLAVSPVRGFALQQRDELELELEPCGARENRRFFLVDADGRRYTLTRAGELTHLAADWDESTGRLVVTFPDGWTVDGIVELGEPVATEFAGPRVVHG